MACSSCNTNKTEKKDHKNCAKKDSCSRAGFQKMGVYDFLAGMQLPHHAFNQTQFVELRFKNGRKDFFYNPYFPALYLGELVCVETEVGGYDIGRVSLTGALVKIQMQKKGVSDQQRLPKILRKTNEEEFQLWEKTRTQEQPTMVKTREIVQEMKLPMKISDVEFQADGAAAIFYYIADGRVDFRQLLKRLGQEFQIRVLMRQIGARQEAAKIGGIGSCGRELCCATWLHDFRTVNTSAARYQQLSINPQKLTGQCGKLKCCLNYELDMYLEAFDEFPDMQAKVQFLEGTGHFFKADIFKKTVWYHLKNVENGIFLELSLDQAREILALNQQKKQPELSKYQVRKEEEKSEAMRIQNRGQILKNRIEKSQEAKAEYEKNNPKPVNNRNKTTKKRNFNNNNKKENPTQNNS